ncbi:TPA: bifunctional phosphoribosylaminoimidazolecarboxamide formyltransferase/IMP cyclohydrolase [Candidatus Gracilibacteria bacterium]|nr:bifunctional phosphoribosylaminoimidazolecarboxamide formyltransferase/IMP cyclohydrolase [Candidatus Gracilibacteria bacterium]
MTSIAIERALISVSDKSGIVEIGKFLADKGVEILSTGGTAKILKENGIKTIEVSDYTGFPEMLDGRVKTLHPKIHGGLLSLRDNKEHQETVAKHNIGNIDLVIVNLYPFADVLAKGGTEAELIENIDIGGPSMLRSAAKNFQSVTVITDPSDYQIVIDEISEYGNTSIETRKRLMGKVYATTASYDAMIASQFSDFYALGGPEVHSLRYGENPHQSAAFFSLNTSGASLPNAKKIQGKDLSYNNLLDADAALRGVLEFSQDAACVIVKHLSPCGTAISDNLFTAYTKALASDSTSAFGGVVALNKEVTKELAEKMNEHFLEIVIAPKISEEAKIVFAHKPNLRVLEIEDFTFPKAQQDTRTVLGGFLVQDIDTKNLEEKDITVVTKRQPTEEELNNLWFAWKAVKNVKSNAIVIAKDGATIGIGGGLTSRIDASELAVKKAGERAIGASCASDAFFPFSDGPETLAVAGITSIIQPGGSRNDQDVIDKCDELGIAMVFTGTRAFKH